MDEDEGEGKGERCDGGCATLDVDERRRVCEGMGWDEMGWNAVRCGTVQVLVLVLVLGLGLSEACRTGRL